MFFASNHTRHARLQTSPIDIKKNWLIQLSQKSTFLESGTNQREKYQRKR